MSYALTQSGAPLLSGWGVVATPPTGTTQAAVAVGVFVSLIQQPHTVARRSPFLPGRTAGCPAQVSVRRSRSLLYSEAVPLKPSTTEASFGAERLFQTKGDE